MKVSVSNESRNIISNRKGVKEKLVVLLGFSGVNGKVLAVEPSNIVEKEGPFVDERPKVGVVLSILTPSQAAIRTDNECIPRWRKNLRCSGRNSVTLEVVYTYLSSNSIAEIPIRHPKRTDVSHPTKPSYLRLDTILSYQGRKAEGERNHSSRSKLEAGSWNHRCAAPALSIF